MEIEVKLIVQVLANTHLFRGISEEQVAQLAAQVKAKSYRPGQVVFAAGDPAESFYIVFQGNVEVHIRRRRKDLHLLTLETGDMFGSESLGSFAAYHSSASAVDEVILLVLDRALVARICQAFPTTIGQFQIIERTFHLLKTAPLTWRKPDEVVYHLARRDTVLLFARWLAPLFICLLPALLILMFFAAHPAHPLWMPIASGILSAVSLLWGVWAWLDWSNDYFIVTNHRVVYQEKVIFLYDSTRETPLDAILSLNTRSGFWGRQFGFGDITIKTYTGTLLFHQVHDPQSVQRLIDAEWLHAKARRQKEDQQVMQTVLRGRMQGKQTAYPARKSEEEIRPRVTSGGLSGALAQLFQLRMERGADIIFRTHWWILLKKTFLPGALILATFGLAVLRATGLLPLFTVTQFLLGVLAVEVGLLLWWTYQYIDWANDMYIISADQLVDINRKPLGVEERRAAPIRNIQSMDYARVGLIGLILNFGTVTILIGTEKLTFDQVYNPSEVQREIFNRFMEVTRHAQMAEQQRMADWIEAYRAITGEDDAPH